MLILSFTGTSEGEKGKELFPTFYLIFRTASFTPDMVVFRDFTAVCLSLTLMITAQTRARRGQLRRHSPQSVQNAACVTETGSFITVKVIGVLMV